MNTIHYQFFGFSFGVFDKHDGSSTRIIDSVFHHLFKDCHKVLVVLRVSIEAINVYIIQ